MNHSVVNVRVRDIKGVGGFIYGISRTRVVAMCRGVRISCFGFV